MTRQPFERILQAFVSDVPEGAPSELLESILIDLPSVKQRRRRFGVGRRFTTMSSPLRAVGIAAAVLVVAVAAYTMLIPREGNVGTTPTQTPSPSPTTAASATPAAVGTPGATPRIADSTLITDSTPLEAGATYVLPEFEPPFAFGGGANLIFAIDGPGYAWFVHPTSQKINAGVVQPKFVFADGGVPEAAPADIVAWLQARNDLEVSTVTPVTLGSVEGTLLEGTVAGDAVQNTSGAINIFCPQTSGCDFESGGSLGYARGDHVLILVTSVDGLPVTAIASAPEADWATQGASLEAWVRSFDFPG